MERNAALFQAMDRDAGWEWIFAHDTSAIFLKEAPENLEILARWRARELPLPETGWTSFLYGRRAWADGDFVQAVEDLGRACSLAPREGEFRALYLLALAAADRPEQARREAALAREELPDTVAVHLAAARLEREGGRGDEAFHIYEEVFHRWPGQLEALDGMLGIDLGRGRDVIEGAYASAPQAPWLRFALGRLAEAEGDPARARQLYEAEGRAAAEAGDRERLLQARWAHDRLPEPSGPGP